MQGLARCPLSTQRITNTRVTRNRAALICKAKSPSISDLPAVSIPGSLEEAVQDAATSLLSCIKHTSRVAPKGSSKGFSAKPPPPSILHAEIPIAAINKISLTSLASSLTTHIVSGLKSSASSSSSQAASSVLVVFSDSTVAEHAASVQERGMLKKLPKGTRFMSLREACREESLEAQLLVVVGPSIEEIALAEQLVEETWAGGAAAVLVNAEFLSSPSPLRELGLPPAQLAFAERCTPAYAFVPVSIKGLLGNMEGVVMLRMEGKSGQEEGVGGTWRIVYCTNGGKYVQVGQMKTRPTNDDLQLAFINASAAQSPLTRMVKGLRGQ